MQLRLFLLVLSLAVEVAVRVRPRPVPSDEKALERTVAQLRVEAEVLPLRIVAVLDDACRSLPTFGGLLRLDHRLGRNPPQTASPAPHSNLPQWITFCVLRQ